MGKEITLEELARSSSHNQPNKTTEQTTPTKVVQASGIRTARPISTSDLGKNLQTQHPEAQKKVVEEDAPVVKNAFESMDRTLAERRRVIEEQVMPVVMENAREMALEKEMEEMDKNKSKNTSVVELSDDDFKDLDDIDKEENKDDGVYVAPVKQTPITEITNETPSKVETKKNIKPVETIESEDSSLEDMMNDLGISAEEEVVDEEEETTEELRERFKASLSGVKITRNPIDLSKFQIAKEPVSVANVLNAISNPIKKRCDHPLLHTGRNMTFEECSGPELDSLRKTINNSNGVNGVIASLKFVYNHVIDANKKSFEIWCKSIRTEDIESLYFGMYKACYSDTNLVARNDGKNEETKKGCDKTSLINTPIIDMIKFKDDEAKQLYSDIMNQDTTTSNSKVKSQTMVISDDFVISYTDPTLYSTFIQYATLKPEITEKYSSYLNTMAYIDGFYRIDYTNNQLIPIAIKEYPNNINKTVMSRLKAYIEILKTLTADQYNVMVAKLDNVIGDAKITYIYPQTECPECGNTIPEEPVESMLNLLFTRAQLIQVKSL